VGLDLGGGREGLPLGFEVLGGQGGGLVELQGGRALLGRGRLEGDLLKGISGTGREVMKAKIK
jgi:hypothetical protein